MICIAALYQHSTFTDRQGHLVVLLLQAAGVHGLHVLRAAPQGQPADVLARLPSQHHVPAVVDWRQVGARRFMCVTFLYNLYIRADH